MFRPISDRRMYLEPGDVAHMRDQYFWVFRGRLPAKAIERFATGNNYLNNNNNNNNNNNINNNKRFAEKPWFTAPEKMST